MPSGVHNWSQTAASNSTADSAIGWAEGQAPSSINDSARAMMAVLAMWRDDISGAIVTGGSSTAYTVTTYTTFSSLALMNNQVVAFTPHATNGATVTLNCDGLGAKPLRAFSGVELQSNVLIAGTPYVAIYNSSDAVFYLQGNAGGTYGIPLGAGMDYFGTTAPSSAFVFPYGQALSRTTYATAFTLFGTTFGVGDGSTTFNVPDLRGRASIRKDDMGGSAASRITTAGGGVDGATLGAVGGAQNVTLASNQIPSLTSTGSNSISVVSTVSTIASNLNVVADLGASAPYYGVGNTGGAPTIGAITSTGSNSISVSYTNGSQAATKAVPPAIICNYILRVI